MDDNQPAPTGIADAHVQENSAASAGGVTHNNEGSNVVPGTITAEENITGDRRVPTNNDAETTVETNVVVETDREDAREDIALNEGIAQEEEVNNTANHINLLVI
jgi:hypothetical protein